METLHARHLSAHYDLPAHAVSQKVRLDRILLEATGHLLEDALAAQGLAAPEWICIRRVDSRVQLRLESPDSELAAQWCNSLVESIRVSVAQPRQDSDLVIYASLRHALADLVEQVLRGRFERAWAWRQAGLWPRVEVVGSRAAEEYMVLALLREPLAIVPLLVVMAKRGLMPELLRWLQPRSWRRLSEEALQAAGGMDLAGILTEESGDEEDHPTAVYQAMDVARCADHLRRCSTLLSTLDCTQITPAVSRSLAALAVIECRPELLINYHRTRALVTALADKLRVPAPPAGGNHHSSAARTQNETKASCRAAGNALDPMEVRQAAETDFGGLLFLLGVIADRELPLEMIESSGNRTLAWTLHQLAMRIVPAEPTDAAVLAFAGLGPQAEPPFISDSPCTPAEDKRLLAWKDLVVDELESRLPHLELRGSALLDFVCSRHCRVLADPGWIELHFSLQDLSTGIRRARLDLDPGYIPWLGVVVKFVYE